MEKGSYKPGMVTELFEKFFDDEGTIIGELPPVKRP